MCTPEEKEFFEAVKRNDEDAVKNFIEEKKINPLITNFNQQTAAHISAENGNLSILKYLVSKEHDLLESTDDKNQIVLHIAVKNGNLDIVKYLIEDLKVDILAEDNRFQGDTAVHIAAEEDQLEVVKYFLETGRAHVSVKDGIGATPLFSAAEKVRMRIVKYLVEERSIDATHRDFQRDNVLYRSAKIGDLTVPKYLLDERGVKIDVDWANVHGRTLLHCAARYNRLDFIKYIIEEKKAEINVSCVLGWTALHEAASEGFVDAVKYLVSKGARVDVKNISGKTPLDVAKEEQVIEYLNEVLNKTRVRRSPFEVQYSSVLTSNLHRASDNWKQEMAISSSYGSLSRSPKLASDVNSVQLGGFILLANTILRKAKKSDQLSNQPNELLSPQQRVQNKVDSLAVDAVGINNFFDR